jgi:hypothetical protein
MIDSSTRQTVISGTSQSTSAGSSDLIEEKEILWREMLLLTKVKKNKTPKSSRPAPVGKFCAILQRI